MTKRQTLERTCGRRSSPFAALMAAAAFLTSAAAALAQPSTRSDVPT